MSDLDQRRRTVRVLGLLSDSFGAHERGDMDETDRLMSEATRLDVAAVSVIQGGMIIGEIPHPGRDWPAWAAYVQAARDALAAAEAEAPGAVILPWCKGCERATPSVPCTRCGGPACAGCGRCPPCDGPVQARI